MTDAAEETQESPIPGVLRTEVALWVGALIAALFLVFGDG